MLCLKQDVPIRGVQDVTKGDYIKTEQGWLMIEHNTAFHIKPLPRNWVVTVVGGQQMEVSAQNPRSILRYAKAEDMIDE